MSGQKANKKVKKRVKSDQFNRGEATRAGATGKDAKFAPSTFQTIVSGFSSDPVKARKKIVRDNKVAARIKARKAAEDKIIKAREAAKKQRTKAKRK